MQNSTGILVWKLPDSKHCDVQVHIVPVVFYCNINKLICWTYIGLLELALQFRLL